MKYLFYAFIFLPIFSLAQKTYKWKGKEYYIYPLRQNALQGKSDVIPYLGKLQDGSYVVFDEKSGIKDTSKVLITISIKDNQKEGKDDCFNPNVENIIIPNDKIHVTIIYYSKGILLKSDNFNSKID